MAYQPVLLEEYRPKKKFCFLKIKKFEGTIIGGRDVTLYYGLGLVVYTSGRTINHEKCSVYRISHAFHNN